jgi:hypothetical protein
MSVKVRSWSRNDGVEGSSTDLGAAGSVLCSFRHRESDVELVSLDNRTCLPDWAAEAIGWWSPATNNYTFDQYLNALLGIGHSCEVVDAVCGLGSAVFAS